MEELLNKLIEKGWKPFGRGTSLSRISHSQFRQVGVIFEWWWEQESFRWCTLRELVSKESNLWQFVCENGMVKMKEWYYWQNIALIHSEEYDYCDYQYRLIESALCDEDKLEDFILSNIVIKDE